MATGSNTKGRKTTKKKTQNSTVNSSKNNYTGKPVQKTEKERMVSGEITLLILLAIAIFLFLCNFGIIGPVGNALSGFLFGIFGLLAYIAPLFIFLISAFFVSNKGNLHAIFKIWAVIVLFITVGILLHLIQGDLKLADSYSIKEIYTLGSVEKKGGGLIIGSIAYLLYSLLDMVGTLLVVIVLAIASFIIITEKSLFKGLKKGGRYVVNSARDDARYRKEQSKIKKEEQMLRRQQLLEEEEERKRKQAEEEQLVEDERILRMDKKVTGVMLNTDLKKSTAAPSFKRSNIHEITVKDLVEEEVVREHNITAKDSGEFDFNKINIHGVHQIHLKDDEESSAVEESLPIDKVKISDVHEIKINYQEEISENEETCFEPEEISPVLQSQERIKPKATVKQVAAKDRMLEEAGISPVGTKEDKKTDRPYAFPPISYLKKSDNSKNKGGMDQLKETAMRLQQTLQTFGVKVTITDISQGPSVTRYELQPEQGVKVSKIVGLADDIKLNLAATDIRMEAPIPGKAAIGIEVPNKENASVGLRDLLESKEYHDFPSKLTFAVGKDIAGKVVVTDIAKMPHMLIAGSTDVSTP